MPKNNDDIIPLSKAILWIFLSTLFVSGFTWMGWLYFLHLKETRRQDTQYQVIAIVQSSPHKESLRTVYLAELLDLSIDQPVNLYQIDTTKAEKKLLESTLIKNVSVKKIRPGTLFVDYTMRIPIAYLGDYTNTAIDEDGYLFPFSPFFTPKKLPTIFLGLEELDKKWGESISNHPGIEIAFNVLKAFQDQVKTGKTELKKIDVTQTFSESFGQKEIVVLVEEIFSEGQAESYYLRMNPTNYQDHIGNYFVLRDHLINNNKEKKLDKKEKEPGVIDFRVDHLAFLKKGSGS